MAIRKKDGNVYVLEGPNPIVKEQASWDPSGLVFHNFRWDELLFSNSSRKAPRPQPKEEIIRAEIPIPSPKEDAPVAELPASTPEPAPTDREFDLPYIKYKALCYCLPATTKIHVDKLYGESWQKVTYGKKIIFPCVVISSSDMELELWTSDPKEQIKDKSIIYPFSYEVHNRATDSYDRVPYDEYRWWKVSLREPKEGGWLMTCVPSEDQPDFSD